MVKVVNDAQKRIGLTKYKYFFFTSLSLSRSGECVSSFKNTGDFVIRALCSDHVCQKCEMYFVFTDNTKILIYSVLRVYG